MRALLEIDSELAIAGGTACRTTRRGSTSCIDRSLLKRVDDAAARRGMTRSGFLAEGARKLLRAISDQGQARKG